MERFQNKALNQIRNCRLSISTWLFKAYFAGMKLFFLLETISNGWNRWKLNIWPTARRSRIGWCAVPDLDNLYEKYRQWFAQQRAEDHCLIGQAYWCLPELKRTSAWSWHHRRCIQHKKYHHRKGVDQQSPEPRQQTITSEESSRSGKDLQFYVFRRTKRSWAEMQPRNNHNDAKTASRI